MRYARTVKADPDASLVARPEAENEARFRDRGGRAPAPRPR